MRPAPSSPAIRWRSPRRCEKLEAAGEPTRTITQGAAHLCIVDPAARRISDRAGIVGDIFASHPPIQQRIIRLTGHGVPAGQAPGRPDRADAGMSGGRLALLALALVAGLGAAGWLWFRTRRAMRERLRRMAITGSRRLKYRLDRYKLVERDRIREALLHDPAILEAIAVHAREHATPEAAVRVRVNEYIDEIVPFFNVLSYYKLGYNLSRLLLNLLYKSSIEYRDHAALDRIPRRDVVVYLMNHRSNADYVVVAYVLARVVSISYAVGEWARTWPLEYVFKSFGSYFIRRRFREPLYHTVLEHYVQLITRNGVTQGIFPEGGLTRDGALRPPKIGLLDYMVRALDDPAFDRDIWLVPVGLNYDRVLEDRALIQERLVGARPLGRWRQFTGTVGYLARNLGRLLTGRLQRYGRVAVNFGTPISVRGWLAAQPSGTLKLPRNERLASHAAAGRLRHGADRRRDPGDPGAARGGGAALVRHQRGAPRPGAGADGRDSRPPVGVQRQAGPGRAAGRRSVGPGLADVHAPAAGHPAGRPAGHPAGGAAAARVLRQLDPPPAAGGAHCRLLAGARTRLHAAAAGDA